MVYYCERHDVLKPHFPNYRTKCETSEEAIAFFKEKHGDNLQIVYNDDFEVVWENNG